MSLERLAAEYRDAYRAWLPVAYSGQFLAKQLRDRMQERAAELVAALGPGGEVTLGNRRYRERDGRIEQIIMPVPEGPP
jgi:hypothetical protein